MENLRPYSDYLTATEAAKSSGASTRTISEWLRRYDGLGVKIGGQWRIHPEHWGRFISGKWETEPPPKLCLDTSPQNSVRG